MTMTDMTLSPNSDSKELDTSMFVRISHMIGSSKIRCPDEGKTVLKFVKDVNWDEQRQLRAGIIPYVINDGYLNLCFGEDYVHKTLTDFGGGVRRKVENPIQGAIREFEEETSSLFNKITVDDIQDCPCIYNKVMLIVFLQIPFCDKAQLDTKFRIRSVNNTEISGLSWIHETEIEILLFTLNDKKVRVYSRVKKFISSGPEPDVLIGFLKRINKYSSDNNYPVWRYWNDNNRRIKPLLSSTPFKVYNDYNTILPPPKNNRWENDGTLNPARWNNRRYYKKYATSTEYYSYRNMEQRERRHSY